MVLTWSPGDRTRSVASRFKPCGTGVIFINTTQDACTHPLAYRRRFQRDTQSSVCPAADRLGSGSLHRHPYSYLRRSCPTLLGPTHRVSYDRHMGTVARPHPDRKSVV